MAVLVHLPWIGELDFVTVGLVLLLTIGILMVFIELVWMIYLATRVWTMYRVNPTAAPAASPVGTQPSQAPKLRRRSEAFDHVLPKLAELSSSVREERKE
jgi:uncharacterized membrane protein (UPF0182 family)